MSTSSLALACLCFASCLLKWIMDLFGGVGFSHVCNYMYDKEWLEDDQGVGEQDANAF